MYANQRVVQLPDAKVNCSLHSLHAVLLFKFTLDSFFFAFGRGVESSLALAQWPSTYYYCRGSRVQIPYQLSGANVALRGYDYEDGVGDDSLIYGHVNSEHSTQRLIKRTILLPTLHSTSNLRTQDYLLHFVLRVRAEYVQSCTSMVCPSALVDSCAEHRQIEGSRNPQRERVYYISQEQGGPTCTFTTLQYM